MVSTTLCGLSVQLRSKRGAQKKPRALKALRDRLLMPPPPPLRPTNPGDKFSNFPAWFVVNTPPLPRADRQGYMKMIPNNSPYEHYANVLGLKPWVIRCIKRYLIGRYWCKSDLVSYNYRSEEKRNRLAEDINIGMRGYAADVASCLRKDLVPEDMLPRMTKIYDAMMAISDAVYKIGSYRTSGYLLYKVCEGVIREVIKDRRKANKRLILLKSARTKVKRELENRKKELVEKGKLKRTANWLKPRRKCMVTLRLDPCKLKGFPHVQQLGVPSSPDSEARSTEEAKKKSLIVVLKVGKQNLQKLINDTPNPVSGPKRGRPPKPKRKGRKLVDRANPRIIRRSRRKIQEQATESRAKAKTLIVKLKVGSENLKKVMKQYRRGTKPGDPVDLT
ncbi:hypothetical protein Dda_1563 [Drechslerella dactyloides]|uniref:Uncharacterized protein n=1 Tax=Drechslerella dactyloides TaxID=74499 RepID=A0AAD6NM65_DREDA|nr:hypothetical protein Dda_1563 [Drechslerella dactyloides]